MKPSLVVEEFLCKPDSIYAPCSDPIHTSDQVRRDELVSLFEHIADSEGWAPDTALRDHIGRSAYFGLIHNNAVIGGIQLVVPTEGSDWWPSKTVWPEQDPVGHQDIGHVLIMALSKEYRGERSLYWRLGVLLWRYCKDRGLREIWLEATPRTFAIYRRIGYPLEVIGDPRCHWGEPCLLSRLRLADVEASVSDLARTSGFYRSVLEKAGL